MKENEAITIEIAKTRGIILNQLIYLERIIDELLSRYFCQDPLKKKDLMLLFLSTSKLNFDSKKLALRFIIEHRYKEFYDKNKNIWEVFEIIIPERNRMAHYLLDSSGDWKERFKRDKSFNLENFDVGIKDTGIKSILYTEERVQDIVNKIEYLVHLFAVFINENLPLTDNPPQ